MKITESIKSEKGFTIIELMISTIIFSLVLLAASAAIVEVGKKYYRGLTNARTQSVARSIAEEIGQSIQYTSQAIKVPNYPGPTGPATTYGPQVAIGDPDTFYFCVGSKRYTFAIDRMLKSDADPVSEKEKKHVMWVDEPTAGCAYASTEELADLNEDNPSGSSAINGRELLNENMRIYNLAIESKANGLWSVVIRIASGDDDLLVQNSSGEMVCEGSSFGTEFCSVSEISLNVSKRIQ